MGWWDICLRKRNIGTAKQPIIKVPGSKGKHMKLISSIAALSMLSLVGACGGGGAATPAAPSALLNSANQHVAAQEAMTVFLIPVLAVELLGGVLFADESVPFGMARGPMEQFPTHIARAKTNRVSAGGVQSQSIACPLGGSLTVSVTDADEDGIVSAGDAMTVVGDDCIEANGTLKGSWGVAINRVSGALGSSDYSAVIGMTFDRLSVSSTQLKAGVSGDLTLSVTLSGGNALEASVSSASLSVSGSYAGETRTRDLSNYRATLTRLPHSSDVYQTSYTVAGILSSSALSSQSISIETTTPFVQRYTDIYPVSGAMVLNGAGNSRVRLTTLSVVQLKQELDANGDGVYESTSMIDWSSLM